MTLRPQLFKTLITLAIPSTALLVSLILISWIQGLKNRRVVNSPDPLPLCYRTLVGAKATNLQSQTKTLKHLGKFCSLSVPPPPPSLWQCCCRCKGSCIGVSRIFAEDCSFMRQTSCILPVKKIEIASAHLGFFVITH